MQETANAFDESMLDLSKDAWLEKLSEIGDAHGYFQSLGKDHCAVFIDEKPTLLVTFETIENAQTGTDNGQPMGFDLVRSLGWSHLCLLSNGDTWFRDKAVYGFFDRLIDDGFFDEFEQVVFYGKGSCGYAAAAFSVAAPGATVIAIQPQATLEPRLTHWDERFHPIRRLSFTDRFGFAPDMLEAAERAYILYDPGIMFDAIHAAMFRRPNTELVRIPYMEGDLEAHLINMQILYKLLAKAMTGKLTPLALYRMLRARREYPHYIQMLAKSLRGRDHVGYEYRLLKNSAERLDVRRMKRRLARLEEAAENGEITLPGFDG
ncbi:phosphoadenosine phosphosulfate reductase [Donghicola tyrosinivorans]|uniref:Phosphoadenosine phosphosulfate reductase n=1 Tax=Donghicola tyrosinivorans TaxID=1652492 RepID=A0A2T0WX56_9RHOB|nr:phosphoadenosine phosphosulfate reductase [Donghicola tyrosinivorans]PRY91280.1 hypothetical protein CLV74_104301 [Donghicola tyrosinivorans]